MLASVRNGSDRAEIRNRLAGAMRTRRSPPEVPKEDNSGLIAAIADAAGSADHSALQQLHAQAPQLFTDDLASSVAFAGDLTTLQFLAALDPPCPISKATIASASEGGRHEAVHWLLQQGCPCDETA